MIPFALCLISCVVVGILCFILGHILSYDRGYFDGFDDCDDFHANPNDPADIRWKLNQP